MLFSVSQGSYTEDLILLYESSKIRIQSVFWDHKMAQQVLVLAINLPA